MPGSINMYGRDIEFNVKVGDRKVLIVTMKDADGNVQSLTNTNTYSTAKFKVWKPDGTLVINGTASYYDRANGQISYALQANDTLLANAGNWSGEIETYNDTSVLSDQSETFNFNLLESY